MANSDPEVQFNLPYNEDGPVNAESPGADYIDPETVSEASDSDSTHRPMSLSKQPSRRRSSRDLWKAVDTLQSCIRDLATEVKVVKGAHPEASANAQTSTRARPVGDRGSSLQQPASSLDGTALINVNMSALRPDAPSFHAGGDSNQPWAAPANHQFTPPPQRAPQRVCMPTNERIKVSPFTGNENWQVWIARFDTIADRMGWGDERRLDHLLQNIEGQAAEFVFTQLHASVVSNYQSLVSEIGGRYRVLESARSFASRFNHRVQQHSESVEEYAANLKMLYDKGHPHRDRRTRDEDLVRQFLDGLLDQDARFEVEFNKEPSNIEDAVFYAVSFLQITKSTHKSDWKQRRPTRRATECMEADDKQRHRDTRQHDSPYKRQYKTTEMRSFNTEKQHWSSESAIDRQEALMQQILKRLESLEAQKSERRPWLKREVECFKCHEKGHYARECTATKQGSPNVKTELRKTADNHLNEQGPALAAKGRSH